MTAERGKIGPSPKPAGRPKQKVGHRPTPQRDPQAGPYGRPQYSETVCPCKGFAKIRAARSNVVLGRRLDRWMLPGSMKLCEICRVNRGDRHLMSVPGTARQAHFPSLKI